MTEQRTSGRFSVLGIIAFVLLAALLLTLAVLSAIKGVRTAESFANVVRVEDGQTFVVNMDGSERTVSLAGVQSPLPAAEGRPASFDNCLAEESAASLSGMLEPGDSVQLQFAADANGPDGNRVALARSGGQMINVAQVEAGLAVPVRNQPMEELGDDLREARETARTEEAGLYSPSVDCTLPGRVTPAVDVLSQLSEGAPSSSSEADAQIETVAAAVEQGVTAEKAFATIDPEGSSLSSLAWAEDVPRLREQLGGALARAEAELASLQSSRKVLLAQEREDAARRAEEARQAELARQREAARQAEIARQEAARQAEAQRRAQEDARRKAEESASASPTPSETPSESPSPSPSSSSASPSEEEDDEDDEADEESSGPASED